MTELIKKLCSLRGPSGFEDAVRDVIRKLTEPYADEIFSDAIGNLYVLRRGRSSEKKLMLCAHMDEVGIIVKSITDDGFLRFGFLGGVDTRVVLGKRVLIGDAALPGVIGLPPKHLLAPGDDKHIPKSGDLLIDIGAETAAEARALVKPGDYGTFDTPPETPGNAILARAIDDRAGCAVLCKLAADSNMPPYDTWLVFSTQEEVGTRGALVAANRIKPDIALVVEGTTAADLPTSPAHERVCSVGGGVVIPFMDGGTIYDRELFRTLVSMAERAGIPWQTKEYISGGTDAAAIQRSATGVKTAGIAAAVRYIHSPACFAALSELDNLYKLAQAFMSGS